MLEKLTEFDWESAGMPQIPFLLRGISSNDANERIKSYGELYDIGLLDLPKVTVYIVPFLVELLKENTPEKQLILSLLMQLSSEATVRLDQQPQGCAICKDVLNEVSKGLDVYFQLLLISETREIALQLLSYVRQDADRIVPQLMSLLSTEEFKDKAQVIYTISDLVSGTEILRTEWDNKYGNYFEKMIDSTSENEAVKTAAAVFIIRTRKVKAPAQAQTIITNSIIEKSIHKSGNISLLCSFIVDLGVQRATVSLIQIIDAINDLQDIFVVIPILLDLTFNNGKIINHAKSLTKRDNQIDEINFRSSVILPTLTSKTDLNTLQAQVANYLANQDKVWKYKSNIFEVYGLPSSRDKLKKFLSA